MTRHEFHVHTNASWCAAAESTPVRIADCAAERGVAVVGLADHLWLDPKRGARPAPDRILKMRPALPAHRTRLLLGAEADCAPGLGLAGGEAVRALDYVVAADHFSELRLGLAPWPDSPAALAARLAAGFAAILEAPAPERDGRVLLVAGHPFYLPPRVWHGLGEAARDGVREAFALLTRDAGPLFARAARRGAAIELNAKALGPRHREVFLPLLRLAREAGCRFVLSSDAHRLDEVGRSVELEAFAAQAGIGQDRLWEPPLPAPAGPLH